MAIKKIIISICLLIVLLLPIIVFAQTAGSPTAGNPAGSVSLTNPLTGNQTSISPQALIGKVIKAVLGIVGSLALVMFIYGGFLWMTSAGNAEQVQKGKNVLIWATLGLAVIFSAYALVKFVIEGITNKS